MNKEKAKEVADHIIMMIRANKLSEKETDPNQIAELIYNYGQEVNKLPKKKIDKKLEFSNRVIQIFTNKYQSLFTNNSGSIIDQFESECLEIARELGMDGDAFILDGEFIGFDNDEHYKSETKYFWWNYYDESICHYEWK